MKKEDQLQERSLPLNLIEVNCELTKLSHLKYRDSIVRATMNAPEGD